MRIEYRYVFEVEKKVEQKPATEVQQPKEAGPPTGRLSGRLRERGTRQPLSGFEVELSSGQRVFTDEQGRFVFEKLPPGEYTLRIDEREFDAIESAESVESGKETEVTYYLERIAFGDSIIVVGKRLKKEVVRRTLTVEEIRFIPGTNGDALRIVQNLPGAARSSPFGNTDLILRGGGNTQVFLNSQPDSTRVSLRWFALNGGKCADRKYRHLSWKLWGTIRPGEWRHCRHQATKTPDGWTPWVCGSRRV